jgi:hypothetical protein
VQISIPENKMGSPKESLAKKNVFAQKYDEIRRLDGTIPMAPHIKYLLHVSNQG